MFIKNYFWTDKDDIPVISAKTVKGRKEGGLAELKIFISYIFIFCFESWNPTATFQKEPQTRVTYTHVCHDHLDPGLTGEMTAAGMFELVDNYLLVLFYLGFACVGFFHFV